SRATSGVQSKDQAGEQLPTHRFEEVQLLGVPFVFEVNRVLGGKAGVAKTLAPATEIRIHTFVAQIGQRIRLDIAADFFNGIGRGDQVGSGRRVDAVIAGTDRRR